MKAKATNESIRLEDGKLRSFASSELHRLLREYRWVHTVFGQIGGSARMRVQAIQSILAKRGVDFGGGRQPPENMRHPAPDGDTTISDHAILRYLERVKGIDVQAVEKEIKEKISQGTSYFSGAVIVDDNDISYIMRQDGFVVSIMPHDWLEDSQKVAAEDALRRGKTERKDAYYRAIAKAGGDTTARKDEA